MMHVKLKLRNRSGLIIPKGPSFSFARKIKTNIDGTQILFKAPKYRAERTSYKPVYPLKEYYSEDINYKVYRDEILKVPYDWETFSLFEHVWTFYGPWFTGIQAELRINVELARPLNYPNKSLSLFQPRAFEQLVGDFLTYRYSHSFDSLNDRKCYVMAPVDWQPYKELSVIAARLNVVSDPTVITLTTKHYLFFPISDNLMIAVNFTPSQLTSGSPDEREKKISSSTMHELMENIIGSIQVKLSPEAKAQQQAAVKGLEDTSLVKEYPPFNWNDPEFMAQTMKQIED